ncbi:MAG TPA: phosphohydrolase [Acidimicrobiales bacterium]|nr:phosphohydrolase [Acidimicrobiales bacterium]
MAGADRGTVSFTQLDQGSEAEVRRVLVTGISHLNEHLVETLLAMLERLKGPSFCYQVDRYEHCVQTATRALRDGASTDMVVGALFHDIADSLSPANHAGVAAAILEPYVDEETTWVVRHHGLFGGYHYFDKIGLDRNARDVHRDSPYFDVTAHFVGEWDQRSFDPVYASEPLEVFLPMVDEVFSRPVPSLARLLEPAPEV